MLSMTYGDTTPAPIVLFVYSRPWHTARTIEALLENEEASESDLIIYSDAPGTQSAESAVEEVRSFIEGIEGFKSKTIFLREHNLGLAESIIDGVTTTLTKYEKVIVLEDDMVTSPHFLQYMNKALDLYEADSEVASIHAYQYPTEQALPDTFFLRGTDCWGWGTWREAWQVFNPDGEYLLNELRSKNLTKRFDYDGSYSYSGMLKDQIRGKNDSWAVRWHASAFLADKLTLFPGTSLVQNIGTDNSGTHCDDNTMLDVTLSNEPVTLERIPVVESEIGRNAIVDFFRGARGSLVQRAFRKATRLLRSN